MPGQNAPESDATPAYNAWNEVATALNAALLSSRIRGISATIVGYDRWTEHGSDLVLRQGANVRSGMAGQPWRSVAADSLHRAGFVVLEADGWYSFHALDLDVLDPPEIDVLIPEPGGLSADQLEALLRDLARRHQGLRFGRTGAVVEALESSAAEGRPAVARELSRAALMGAALEMFGVAEEPARPDEDDPDEEEEDESGYVGGCGCRSGDGSGWTALLLAALAAERDVLAEQGERGAVDAVADDH